MRTENQLKSLNDELRAIKTAYEQVAYSLILYTYELNLDGFYIGDIYYINKTVIFNTDDGSNAIASIEGAVYDRMPYEGGAKFFIYSKQGSVIKLHTMQTGEVVIP